MGQFFLILIGCRLDGLKRGFEMVSEINFCGNSLNEVAQCLAEDQAMMVKFYAGKSLPVDVVTYPVFEMDDILKNSTVVYVPCSQGYYRVIVVMG